MHLLVEYPPSVAIPKLVNSLQGESSRRLRQQRPDIARRYWNGVPSRHRAAALRSISSDGMWSSKGTRTNPALKGRVCALQDWSMVASERRRSADRKTWRFTPGSALVSSSKRTWPG